MRKTRMAAAAAVAMGGLVAGYAAMAQPTPTWTSTVGQIFADNCTRCHGGATPRAGLNLSTYASAIAGSANGPVLIAGNPAGSLLMRRITGEVPPQMPRGGAAPLSAETIAVIAAWITAGMPQ